MKTRSWIFLIAGLLLLCLGLSALTLSRGAPARYAQIVSDGRVVKTVDLMIDQEFTVTSQGGENTVTVSDGRIGVTAATCPDQYCVERGMCSGGVQIVCLPNRLVIRFLGEQSVDAVAG